MSNLGQPSTRTMIQMNDPVKMENSVMSTLTFLRAWNQERIQKLFSTLAKHGNYLGSFKNTEAWVSCPEILT